MIYAEDVVTKLKDNSEVNSWTNGRVYDFIRPQLKKCPAIVVHVKNTPTAIKGSYIDDSADLTIYCFEDNYKNARTLSDKVLTALDDWVQTIMNITSIDDEYLEEVQTYAKVITFKII
ncbi:DUF3168 domain-containing protein [Flammeovirga sp. OC4]|uniref:tail completion protein gp17 n=1 Tax=Flammeovirga sp. OC4 TaxID=1382345 RepID=UPI0005C71301|nr:DUF3168 domain-containing protein [Flammeovirga sp. OC4]